MVPEMDGFECNTKLREIEAVRNARTPIIALTAHVLAGDREKCLAAGMDDYICKPLNLQELVEIVAKYGSRRASMK